MESKDKNKIKELQKIDKMDLIYLSVIILLFIIIGFIFVHSTGFIIKNINKIFSTNEETATQTLDIERYSLLEKKLGLPNNINIQIDNEIKEEVESEPKESELITEDNSLLKINITNATKKDGAAAQLSKELEAIGFSKAKTESQNNIADTTIQVKDIEKGYSQLILDIVKVQYPKAVLKTMTRESKYDVIITLGK